MPRVSHEELLSRLTKGKPIPALLLLGDEPFLRDATRAQLIETFDVVIDARDNGQTGTRDSLAQSNVADVYNSILNMAGFGTTIVVIMLTAGLSARFGKRP